MFNTSKAIIEKVRLPLGKGEPFSFDVKRDDLIDPIVSGNKWRKLKYNLLTASNRKNKGILTFGGPYSNHLVATAKAASQFRVGAIGIVRGDELNAYSNPTLKACTDLGMKLIFVSRSNYRRKDEPTFLKQLHEDYPNYFFVPEGGKNYYGVIGCQEILQETSNDYDHVYLAGGTGTTGAGLVLGATQKSRINVVSALKGSFIQDDINALLHMVLNEEEMVEEYKERLIVHNDAHFGGYGKVPQELITYINSIYESTGLKLDPIYTAKAMYQMEQDFRNKIIQPNEKVLFVHTGGLQGALSWKESLGYLKDD
ncbi:1-aminocyclopropane-1-carboxylate deaminase/D-cysteine desulfhydrase [Brumimicrobium oceani]|uniref:1-aminocyclopropane-1-carboxylate deaminase/D-cysteine desulfhydrase n=1 Tax=Brumimicrobium oceani TaxID=2100725 RepID=UPI001304E802|nr:pyridoxal-phosphate dependent enzyme [Brumimicrobium oceani]